MSDLDQLSIYYYKGAKRSSYKMKVRKKGESTSIICFVSLGYSDLKVTYIILSENLSAFFYSGC